MKKFVLPALALAAMFATVGGASAQIFYSGPGYGVHIEPRYGYERDYDRRDYRYNRRHYSRNANGCPPRYTVQNGVCKPYRGY